MSGEADFRIVVEEEVPSQIVIEDGEMQVLVEEESFTVIDVAEQGPEGPQGQPGIQGPKGEDGGHYFHPQGEPSDTWVINHNLGFKPNVTVLDSGGTEVEGSVVYPDDNTVIITFSSAFSGQATLS